MENRIEIRDFDLPELDIYARLSEVQLLRLYEPKEGIFIAESPKVIERALNAGYQPISALVEDKHIEGEAKEVISRLGDIPVYTAPFNVLTNLTGFQLTRGMLCAMRRLPLPTVTQVCTNAQRIAVLEDILNPTNIGAIFRSAAALDMDGILLTKACSNPLYRRAIRVSMGTVFQIPWTFLDAPSPKERSVGEHHYITQLKALGFSTAAMALREDSVSIDHPSLMAADKLALILGTEGEGLQNSTIQNSDYTVRIPMQEGVDSLNVAAASAVAFWQLHKR